MDRFMNLISRVLRQFFSYRKYEVLRRDLSNEVEIREPAIEVTWKLGTEADVDRLTPEDHNCDEVRAKELKRQLAIGSRMVYAEHEGEIVHVSFVHFKYLADSGYQIELAPNVGVSHDVRTVERYRGKGLQLAGGPRRRKAAIEAGADWTVSIVEVSNGVSLRNSVRGGMQVFGRIHVVRVLRWFYFVRVPRSVREWCANPTPFD